MTMKTRAMLLLTATVLFAVPVSASDYGKYRHQCRPVGSWLININFADQPVPFQQLLVINADRTLQETNTRLHPNTPPFPDPTGAPPTTGSEGVGTWKRLRGCRIQFSFLKFVYAGDAAMGPMDLPPGAPPPPPAGVHIGFFKVSGIAKIVGNTYLSEADVKSEVIIGPDPFAPDAFRIDVGESTSAGVRLLASD
jgi:hypothetical protein